MMNEMHWMVSDSRKFKLFTTSKSLAEIQTEAKKVERLYEMANNLYNQNQEEKTFIADYLKVFLSLPERFVTMI